MIFNEHSNLEGQHAFLGASQYRWLNYTEEDLRGAYLRSYAQQIGTILHELVKDLISSRIKVNKMDKHLVLLPLVKAGVPRAAIDMDWIFPNFMAYVNDAIGFHMTPEVVLVHSYNCFGTADAIAFRDDFLRIHDYKSGAIPAKMEQLEIYAALFCLEYKKKPMDISTELRIYQGSEVLVHNPEPALIMDICNRIIRNDNIIDEIRRG